MRKLIFLIIIPFILSGCYDYHDLNDLAIITSLGIDYKDGEYITTLEILSPKNSKEDSTVKGYTISNKGKSIVEALDMISTKMDKIIYFGHLDIVLIDEEIAKNHLDKVVDHLTRCPKLRNEFYMVIIEDGTAKDALEIKNSEIPVVSTHILNLLEQSKENDNIANFTTFIETLSNILSYGTDAIMSTVKKSGDNIVLTGQGLFKGYSLQGKIDKNTSLTMNLLNNFNIEDITYSNTCKVNSTTTVSIYNGKVDLQSDNDKIKVKAKLEGWMKEENCGYNLRESSSYIELQDIFSKIIKQEIIKTINMNKALETNALNLGRSYYINTRKKDYYAWLNQDIDVQIDLQINKKGLAFEIKEEE